MFLSRRSLWQRGRQGLLRGSPGHGRHIPLATACPGAHPHPSGMAPATHRVRTLSRQAPAAKRQHGPMVWGGHGGCTRGWNSLAHSCTPRVTPRSPEPALTSMSYMGITWLQMEKGPGGGVEASLGQAGALFRGFR